MDDLASDMLKKPCSQYQKTDTVDLKFHRMTVCVLPGLSCGSLKPRPPTWMATFGFEKALEVAGSGAFDCLTLVNRLVLYSSKEIDPHGDCGCCSRHLFGYPYNVVKGIFCKLKPLRRDSVLLVASPLNLPQKNTKTLI